MIGASFFIIAMGIFFFMIFGLESALKSFSDGRVKIEEERTERRRIDLDIAKVQAGNVDKA